jgi:hypothetical protein
MLRSGKYLKTNLSLFLFSLKYSAAKIGPGVKIYEANIFRVRFYLICGEIPLECLTLIHDYFKFFYRVIRI